MDKQKVKSSNIASIGYDEEKKILQVEFIRSGYYIYSDVSKETYSAFINAPSKGKYFFKNIKGNYKFKKGE